MLYTHFSGRKVTLECSESRDIQLYEEVRAYLQTETLTLDVGQSNGAIVLSRLLHQVTLLTLIFLDVLLCSWTHHRHFHLYKTDVLGLNDFLLLIKCWIASLIALFFF